MAENPPADIRRILLGPQVLDDWKVSHASMDMGPDSYVIKQAQVADLKKAKAKVFDATWLR